MWGEGGGGGIVSGELIRNQDECLERKIINKSPPDLEKSPNIVLNAEELV